MLGIRDRWPVAGSRVDFTMNYLLLVSRGVGVSGGRSFKANSSLGIGYLTTCFDRMLLVYSYYVYVWGGQERYPIPFGRVPFIAFFDCPDPIQS